MNPNIALLQIPGNNSLKDRFPALLEKLRSTAKDGAQILLLPELFLHDYFPQEMKRKFFNLAHGVDMPLMKELQSLAEKLEVVLVIPFFEKRTEGVYHNSAVVFDADGSNLGIYRKMHIPDDPGFYEKYYFTPGDLGFKVFSTRYGKLGVLICWDQWFPEAARLTALMGCDLLIYPTAIGWDKKELGQHSGTIQEEVKKNQVNAWKTIQKSHAIANGVFVASINRIGTEGDLIFWGNSFLCGPFGEEIGSLGENEEEALLVSCDWTIKESTRRIWPFLRDRRIDAYSGILNRFSDPE